MKRLTAALGLIGLVAAGLLAALALAPPAKAWSPNDLPPGWQVHHEVTGGVQSCPEDYRIFEYDAHGVFVDVSPPMCLDSPTYQQDFDAWIDARYSPPPATTTAPPVVSTTVTVTTPAPPATTTDTTSAPTPGPAPAPAPTTIVVTTTATPVEQSLQGQIDALTKQLAALTDRVTRIEKAGDAAWLAFEQAVQGGATIPDAAEQARGTWLDAVYQLGAFAP